MTLYRSWHERRQILAALVSEQEPPPLASFALSEAEEAAFRAHAAALIALFARRSSPLKRYSALPFARPFRNVVYAAVAVITAAGTVIAILSHYAVTTADRVPLITAGTATAVAATGWVIAGWLTHRNAIRQNTNTLLFARFSQATFADSVHRFHRRFGFDITPLVDQADLDALRLTGIEEDWRTATAVTYLLNYFELVAHGVLKGDLDPQMVRDNFRGIICFYHDKCRPIVRAANLANARTYGSLIALRMHYQEP